MPFPPKNRPGSSLPAGRNFKGNRFAGLETAGEEKAEAAPKKKVKGKKKKGKNPFAGQKPAIPSEAFGMAAAMRKAPFQKR